MKIIIFTSFYNVIREGFNNISFFIKRSETSTLV